MLNEFQKRFLSMHSILLRYKDFKCSNLSKYIVGIRNRIKCIVDIEEKQILMNLVISWVLNSLGKSTHDREECMEK